MSELDRLQEDIVFSARLRGRELTFHTTWGLFSPRRIDDGSYQLIEQVEVSPADRILDLGCGYGAIGVALAGLAPQGEVHMVDRDFLAVEYAARNARLNGFRNCRAYLSNAFSAVEDLRFDTVVSNLPANVGKEMLSIILLGAHASLKPGGRVYVVTISGLRQFIRRRFEDVFGNYTKSKQAKGYTVAMATRE